MNQPPLFLALKIAQGGTPSVSPCDPHPAAGPRSPAAQQESSSEDVAELDTRKRMRRIFIE